jgi:hypothetical protein
LGVTSAGRYADRVAAFREGLKEVGFIENQNVTVEYRWQMTVTSDFRNWRLNWWLDGSG